MYQNFLYQQGKSEEFDSCDRPSNLTQVGVNSPIFLSPCELAIWWMTPKNNRAPFLYYIKLYASSIAISEFKTELTVRKRSIRVKIGDFLSRVTLKFVGWPWKTMGRLFHTALSVVYHFKAMGELKLELQSGNAQFGSKSTIFFNLVTLEFDGWPWKTIGHLS